MRFRAFVYGAIAGTSIGAGIATAVAFTKDIGFLTLFLAPALLLGLGLVFSIIDLEDQATR